MWKNSLDLLLVHCQGEIGKVIVGGAPDIPGATMLDINAGVTSVNPNETEPGLLVQTMEIVQGLVDVPLAIDSSVTAAIEAALKVAKGRPLVNSVTGEEEKLEAILPLCAKYNVPVVAISNDETGISQDPDVRFAVADVYSGHVPSESRLLRGGPGTTAMNVRTASMVKRPPNRGPPPPSARGVARPTLP